MAFIQSVSVVPLQTQQQQQNVTKCPSVMTMTTPASGKTSRRSILRLMALGVAGIGLVNSASAARKEDDDFNLGELKKDVEELSYEDEVLDVGPDSREKNPTRLKKKVKEPEYVKEEKKIIQDDKDAYGAMVAAEKADEKKIKDKFSKSK